MQPKEDLFELIENLSANEKRYFKLRHTSNNNSNYLKLFDEIDKQQQYDEDGIRRKFKEEKFIKQLTFTKNYLYNSIINSLISYNTSSSSETHLVNLVLKLRLLFKKGLFKQYFKELETAKKKAREYEKFYILLEILRLSRLISETRKFRTLKQELLYEEEKEILKKISNLGEYSRLFYLAQTLKRKVGVSGKKPNAANAERILKNKLLSDTKYALSTQALEYFFHIKQVLYSIKGDTKEQYNICKKRLECVEKNPKPFLDDIVDVRKEALITLAELSMELQKKDDFKRYMGKYFISTMKAGEYKTDNGIITNFINLKYLVSTGDLEKGSEVCQKVENGLVRYKGKLDKDIELESIFLITKFYFYTKDYSKALENINSILSNPVIKFRRDIYSYSKLLNLLIHYELGNFDLVDYLIDSVSKHLKNERELYTYEIEVIDLIQKTIGIKSGKNFKEKFYNIKNDISILKKASTSKNSFYYFDLLSWIEEKLSSIKSK